jgi:hypothetical protein
MRNKLKRLRELFADVVSRAIQKRLAIDIYD